MTTPEEAIELIEECGREMHRLAKVSLSDRIANWLDQHASVYGNWDDIAVALARHLETEL